MPSPTNPGKKNSNNYQHSLGIVTWKDMFENDNLNLPNTSIMSQVRQLIPHEQCQQMSNEIITIMQKKKEDFYKGTNHTLQDAKDQLNSILTKVITDRSEYVIDKSIERTERNLAMIKQ